MLTFFVRHEVLINFVGRFFLLLKIFYFSICLTSDKLYWIEDQLADVSTRFYTQLVGVGELNRQRVDRNLSCPSDLGISALSPQRIIPFWMLSSSLTLK